MQTTIVKMTFKKKIIFDFFSNDVFQSHSKISEIDILSRTFITNDWCITQKALKFKKNKTFKFSTKSFREKIIIIKNYEKL